MEIPVELDIKIVDLEPKLDNPRFGIADDPRDAIEKMLEDQGGDQPDNNLISLAKDILERGLDPSKRIIVTPHPSLPQKYEVLEGNRRVISLKLLFSPEIIEGTYKKAFKKFKEFHGEFIKSPLTLAKCIVYQNPEESKHWIELNHSPGNEGAGTVRWDAQQSARFKGKPTMALQILDFAAASPDLPVEIKGKLSDISAAGLERILGNPEFRAGMGLKKEGDLLHSEYPPEVVRPRIYKLLREFADGKVPTARIYKLEDRLKFLEDLTKDDPIDVTKKISTSWGLDKPPTQASSPTPQNSAAPNPKPQKPSKPTPNPKARKQLIPSNFKLTITETKPLIVFNELKGMDIYNYTNSVGVMFRVFLEITIDCYIKKRSVPNKKDHLKDKIHNVVVFLKDQGIMTEQELTGARSLVQAPDGYFNVNTFHQYVHGASFQPDPISLITTWDNVQLFIQKIWETYN